MTYKEYIPNCDYVDKGTDLDVGEQVNVNHTNCTAGEDTKQRLYILKRGATNGYNNDVILAYCHNCGLSGRHFMAGTAGHKYAGSVHSLCSAGGTVREEGHRGCGDGKSTGAGGDAEGRGSRLPSDYISGMRIGDWGAKQRVWVTKYGITQAEIELYRLGYSQRMDAVILPIRRNGTQIGHQARLWATDKPKYLTRTTEKPLWWFSGDYNHSLPVDTCDGIALVEDVLSGIKCARFVPTIALLGANLGDKLAAFAALKNTHSNKFIVFLDDDNRQVKLSQLKIKATLEQMGYEVKLITGVGKDPKACSEDELEKLLCR